MLIGEKIYHIHSDIMILTMKITITVTIKTAEAVTVTMTVTFTVTGRMMNEDKERDDHNYNDYFKTEKQQREAESTYQKNMYVDLKLLMNNPYKQTSSRREVQCI